MGMHEPGWRERNEERATEQWRADVARLVKTIRLACDNIERGQIIGECDRIDDATEELFKLRHAPENPSHA